ncbi:MAG: hypothetical protein JXR94_03350, partial [Candidatus Hydrogenedentes bacterium]|nr:hypothetical protein [Candidatus Hydrogenedentota bacterium]
AWAKESGLLEVHEWRDWVDENYEQVATHSLPDLSVAEINALIDEGLRRFYLRPAQMFRMLFNIRSAADVRAKLHGLKSFVGYFHGKGKENGMGSTQ